MVLKFNSFLIIALLFCVQSAFPQKKAPLLLEEKTQSVDSTYINDLYSKAMNDIAYQDLESAEKRLQLVLKSKPDHDEARFTLLRIYYSQKKIEETEKLAKAGIEASSQKPLFLEALADIYKETKNYDALIPVFDQLIDLNPDQIKNYLDKAYTLTLLKDYSSALAVYNKAETQFGAEENIYSGRTGIYLQKNQKKKAEKEVFRYRKKNPKDNKGYLMLAHLYLDLKEPQKALESLAEAEKLFPENPVIYLTKADAYKQLNNDIDLLIQLKKAFAMPNFEVENKINVLLNISRDFEFDQAMLILNTLCDVLIENHPSEAKAYAVYGDVLLQQEKSEDALVKFKKALALDPQTPHVWESVLQIEIASGNYQHAQTDGEKALELMPQHPVLLYFTGYAYLLDHNHEKARHFLEEALNNVDVKNETLMLQIYNNLAGLYHKLEMHEVSDAAYEEALKIDSNNSYILNNYAYYLSLRKKDLDKAEAYIKRSNELQPGNPSFQDTYAWVLFKQEKFKEALLWIEYAMESMESPSMTLLDHYGDILFKLGKEKEALAQWKAAYERAENEEEQSLITLKKKINTRAYVE